MAYCGPRGIPYDEWMGLGDGWTPFSREAALAWQAREASRCHTCGQVHDDWVGADGVELRHPPAMVIDHYCPGCAALDEARQGDDPKDQRKLPRGVSLRFAPTPAASSPDGEVGGTVPG